MDAEQSSCIATAAPGIDLVKRIASALNVHIAAMLPSENESDNAHRQTASHNFERILSKAGHETMQLLNLFLVRVLDSASFGQ